MRFRLYNNKLRRIESEQKPTFFFILIKIEYKINIVIKYSNYISREE